MTDEQFAAIADQPTTQSEAMEAVVEDVADPRATFEAIAANASEVSDRSEGATRRVADTEQSVQSAMGGMNRVHNVAVVAREFEHTFAAFYTGVTDQVLNVVERGNDRQTELLAFPSDSKPRRRIDPDQPSRIDPTP